jgi:hypothetical protein
VQGTENESLHRRLILQPEMARPGRGEHAGDAVERFTPPAGDPLQLLAIEETVRIGA